MMLNGEEAFDALMKLFDVISELENQTALGIDSNLYPTHMLELVTEAAQLSRGVCGYMNAKLDPRPGYEPTHAIGACVGPKRRPTARISKDVRLDHNGCSVHHGLA